MPCLYRDVGGDGAGFLGYLFGGTDVGEPAPTSFISFSTRKRGGDGAGFLGYLFGGTDVGEPAPTSFISFYTRKIG